MKLSIIIPVYNTENYLSNCLQTVFDQDLQSCDYEVIVINDGSPDQSEQIILQFAALHPNLVYIRQSNQGVSAARNAGLDLAKGEYITFVDSDDEIEKKSLKVILNKLEKDNLDILYPKIDTYSEKGGRLGNLAFGVKYDEIKNGFLQERRTYPPTFYRKELIKDMCFDPTISIGEDTLFNAKAQALAGRVSFINFPYYKYIIRQNSLSKQGKSEKAFRGFVKAIVDLRSFENQKFKDNKTATKYFDKVYEIFITRIIELNILPTLNREKYTLMVSTLKVNHLSYILKRFETKYPGISTYYLFATYQKYLNFKSTIHRLLHKNA